MTAPASAVVRMSYQAECLRCGWLGKARKDSADAHGDRRLHLLTHVAEEVKKGGGKR